MHLGKASVKAQLLREGDGREAKEGRMSTEWASEADFKLWGEVEKGLPRERGSRQAEGKWPD